MKRPYLILQRPPVLACGEDPVSVTTGRSTGCHVHFEVIVGGEVGQPGPLPAWLLRPARISASWRLSGLCPGWGRENRDDLSAAGSLESQSASPSPSQSPTSPEPESPSSSSSASPSASTSPSPQPPESTGSEQPTRSHRLLSPAPVQTMSQPLPPRNRRLRGVKCRHLRLLNPPQSPSVAARPHWMSARFA